MNTHNNDQKKYPAPFSLRLSREEKTELKRLANGQPMGQFIKDAIFDKGLRPPTLRRPAPVDRQLLSQILGMLGQSRIPQNINQLAKAANSGSLPVNKEVIKALIDACKTIEWMRQTLIKGMGLKPQSDDKNARDRFNDPER